MQTTRAVGTAPAYFSDRVSNIACTPLPNKNENILTMPLELDTWDIEFVRNPLHAQARLHSIRQEDRASSLTFGVLFALARWSQFPCKFSPQDQERQARRWSC
jgi:hypothetical protein